MATEVCSSVPKVALRGMLSTHGGCMGDLDGHGGEVSLSCVQVAGHGLATFSRGN